MSRVFTAANSLQAKMLIQFLVLGYHYGWTIAFQP